MKTGQAQEFSMDDVLESIRRIISDGETPAEADKGAADPAISRGFLEGFEQAARTVSLADPEQPPAPAPRPSLRREPVEPVAAAPAVTAPAAPAAPVRAERPALAPRPAYTSPRPLPSARPAPALRGTASADPVRSETPRAEAPRAGSAERLMSRAAESAVESAFGSLGQAVVSRQPQTTVEDLVKDLMRPMVSAWLDRNLPSLVERLVQAEIQRLARGD